MVTSCGKKQQLSLPVPVGHLCVFGKVSIWVFVPLFNPIVCLVLFDIELSELFIYLYINPLSFANIICKYPLPFRRLSWFCQSFPLRNENKCYNEVSPHPCQNSYHQKDHK